jgi:hypothetical protein
MIFDQKIKEINIDKKYILVDSHNINFNEASKLILKNIDPTKIILSNYFVQFFSNLQKYTYVFLQDGKALEIEGQNILIIETVENNISSYHIEIIKFDINKFIYLPLIEFYEYQIHNYNTSNKYNKFGEIDDSESLKECGRISIEGEIDDKQDTNRSSCDPIKSLSKSLSKSLDGGSCLAPFPSYDIDNLYYNYRSFLTKIYINDFTELYGTIDDININININKIINNIKNAYETQKKIVEHNATQISLKEHINSVDEIPIKKINDIDGEDYDIDENLLKLEELGLVYNFNMAETDKIILFGDFHGSFHTFFRILCRLHRYGVINLETLEINDPYKIIFLGDIIDRGNFGIDILNIIFKMIIINNKNPTKIKIILNRGNHESYVPFMDYGFYEEIKNKLNYNKLNYNKYNIYLLITYLLKLFAVSFSAVIINQTNSKTKNRNRIWCCHGGFTSDYISVRLPADKIIFFNEPKTESTNYFSSPAYDIRWSDFNNSNESVDFNKSSNRGTGKLYSYQGTNKFLKTNNINFIIRGHQDNINNSVLFDKNNNNKIKINNPINKNINDLLYYNNNASTTYTHRKHGPIAKLRAHSYFCNDNIYPVLTISTNTDLNRDFDTDSFILLRFDDYSSINFYDDSIGLNIINPIKKVLKNPKINKESIIHTNLNIIIDILELLNNNIIKKYIHSDWILAIQNGDETKKDITQKRTEFLEKDKNIQFYIKTLINMYEECKNIGDYYSKKINKIITKVESIIKPALQFFTGFSSLPSLPSIDISQIAVFETYKNDFVKLKEKYDKINEKFNQGDTNEANVAQDGTTEEYKTLFNEIKVKFEAYWKYNDENVWNYIQLNKENK